MSGIWKLEYRSRHQFWVGPETLMHSKADSSRQFNQFDFFILKKCLTFNGRIAFRGVSNLY